MQKCDDCKNILTGCAAIKCDNCNKYKKLTNTDMKEFLAGFITIQEFVKDK